MPRISANVMTEYQKIVPRITEDVDLVCFGGIVDGDVPPSLRTSMGEYGRVKFNGTVPAAQGLLKTDVYVWNKVFRKSIIDKYGVRFPVGIACGEDATFYFCYAAVARNAHYVQEYLYHYVQQAGSAMASFRKASARGADHLRVVEYVCDFYMKHKVLEDMQPVYDRVFAAYYELAIATTPPEMHSELEKQAYELAVRSGAIHNHALGHVRNMLTARSSWIEKKFHWFVANRECYGIWGVSLYSLTYEDTGNVHRILGRVIKKTPEKDLT